MGHKIILPRKTHLIIRIEARKCNLEKESRIGRSSSKVAIEQGGQTPRSLEKIKSGDWAMQMQFRRQYEATSTNCCIICEENSETIKLYFYLDHCPKKWVEQVLPYLENVSLSQIDDQHLVSNCVDSVTVRTQRFFGGAHYLQCSWM